MTRAISLVLAVLGTAVTIWFVVMTLRHEFPDAERNADAIKAVISATLTIGMWIVFFALGGWPRTGAASERWQRRGWGDGSA